MSVGHAAPDRRRILLPGTLPGKSDHARRCSVWKRSRRSGGVALLSMPEFKGKTAVYTGIDKAKFRAMAKPGDTLRLEVHFTKRRGPMAVAEGVAWVGDQKAAEAEIKCMVIMD